MNTINGNYNYNNYNNYTYTGNLGTGNTGYMNYGNILNNANVNGGAYAAPNTDTSSKGFFSKLFDGSILGGLAERGIRLWGNIRDGVSKNVSKFTSDVFRKLGGALTFFNIYRDTKNSYDNNVQNGVNPWTWEEGGTKRDALVSATSNGLSVACGAGAGLFTASTGIGAPLATTVGMGAGALCYEIGDWLGNKLADNILEEQDYNNSYNYYN